MKALIFLLSTLLLIVIPAIATYLSGNEHRYLSYMTYMCPPESDDHRLVFDVGGNKGYTLPRYGFIFGNLDLALVKHNIKHLISKTNYWYSPHGLEVHVFEPTSSAFKVLQTLQEALPFFHSLYLHNFGVSESNGNTTFYIPYNNIGDEGGAMSAVGRIPSLPTHLKEEVSIVKLDDFYFSRIQPRLGSVRIEYIKIDVEGFDSYVVRGMKSLLEKRIVRAFEFEYGNSWRDGRTGRPQSLEATVSMLQGLKYECFLMSQSLSKLLIWTPISGSSWKSEYESISLAVVFCIDAQQPCYKHFSAGLKITSG